MSVSVYCVEVPTTKDERDYLCTYDDEWLLTQFTDMLIGSVFEATDSDLINFDRNDEDEDVMNHSIHLSLSKAWVTFNGAESNGCAKTILGLINSPNEFKVIYQC